MTNEVQVVIRSNEYCEACGGKNPFRKGARGTIAVGDDGQKMMYGECRKCGAPVKIYWVDASKTV